MYYRFLQAAHVGGRDYSRGVHEVTEKTEQDPYFLRLVGASLIVEAESPVVAAPLESPQERTKRLHDKLVKQLDEKTAKRAVPVSKAPVETKLPESASEEKNSDDEKSSKEKKSSDKHDKHHKR